ncbi:MAG: hypothetical protein IT483_10475 [Gammaproteobacteria bacterium]|nr:hypothetical protein [Gammaproteobacteria bacterium]
MKARKTRPSRRTETCDHHAHAKPDPASCAARQRLEIEGRSGRLSYYVAGKGPPPLLVHSINARRLPRLLRGTLGARPASWTVRAFDTGALVYFERPKAFCNAWDAFLARG